MPQIKETRTYREIPSRKSRPKSIVVRAPKRRSRARRQKPKTLAGEYSTASSSTAPPKLSAIRDPVQKVVNTLADPWLGSCCLPDTSIGSCLTIKYVIPISTDSLGWGSAIVSSDPGNAYFTSVGNGASQYSFPNASSYVPIANLTTFANLFTKMRTVSMGFKWFPTTAATADSGTIECADIPGTLNPSFFNGFSSVQAEAITWEEGPARQVCKMTWRPDDYGTMVQFRAFNSGTTTLAQVPSPGSWAVPYLFFGIQGAAASTTVGRLEVVVNIEAQVRAQGFYIGEGVAEKPPAVPDWPTKIANGLRKTLQFALPVAKTVLSLL